MAFAKRKPFLGSTVRLISASSLAEGFKALIRLRANGFPKVYDLWSAEEIRQSPAKSDVKLYYFPAQEPKLPRRQYSPQVETPNPDARHFALICPGGAYATVGLIPEGFPTAVALNDQGYSAFVLNYRTGRHARYPAPMDDLAQAVRFILDNARQLHIDPERYSTWGYSAGGHLVSIFGTDSMGAPKYGLPRPCAVVAAYPLVSMGENTHRLSRILLLGRHFTDADVDQMSVERQITPDYPPTFIWTCTGDPIVDAINSNLLAQALAKNGVQHQLLKFEVNLHGCGLGRGTPVDGWFEAALDFWRQSLGHPAPSDIE